MAYTTPRTWVAAEIATAANLNTHVRDNIAWLATDSPCVSAYSSTTQATTSGTMVAVNLPSELFDNCTGHSTSSNTNRITVPTGGGGKYLIALQVMYTAAITFGQTSTLIQLNTTTAWTNAISEVNGVYLATTVWTLAAADWVTGMAIQTSGSGKNLGNDGTFVYAPWFAAFWFRN